MEISSRTLFNVGLYQPPSPEALSHDDYMVGWICNLSKEMAAAMAMLDNHHPALLQPSGDRNTYKYGEICGHNVVITCLPAGVYGTSSATAAVTQMRVTFPCIQFYLLVGIGGGVPSRTNDIRLGDIVVSKPTANTSGVVQYDFGKTAGDGCFQPTGTSNKPSPALLSAFSQLDAQNRMGKRKTMAIICETAAKYPDMVSYFTCPGSDQDLLFEAGYDHVHPDKPCVDCCDLEKLVTRASRTSSEPKIFSGTIASANQVMKHGLTRDRLASEHGILCFEMEAAGIVEHVPYLVIRGICDYADSHKQKEWQDYASGVAAAYAKELLAELPRFLKQSPLPIPAVVMNISHMCVSASKTLRSISASYKDAPMHIVSICSETSALISSLSQVQSLLLRHSNIPEVLGSRPDLATALDAALTGCMVLFGCFDDKIRQLLSYSPRTSAFPWRRKVRVTWDKVRLKEDLEGLRSLQVSLNLLIQLLLHVHSPAERSNIIREGSSALYDTVKRTQSLRSTHPDIGVPESIFSPTDFSNIIKQSINLSDQEFDPNSIMAHTKVHHGALDNTRAECVVRHQTMNIPINRPAAENFCTSSAESGVPEYDSSEKQSSATVSPEGHSIPESGILMPNTANTGLLSDLKRVCRDEPLYAAEPTKAPTLTNMNHATAVKCNDCGKDTTQEFYRRFTNGNGTQYCQTCYHKSLDLLCQLCQKEIQVSDGFQRDGKYKYHSVHTCDVCGVEIYDRIYDGVFSYGSIACNLHGYMPAF